MPDTFSARNITGEFTLSFSNVSPGLRSLFEPVVQTGWYLVFNDSAGNPTGRIVIQSEEDMRRCYYDGDYIPVRFEKYVAGEWVFVQNEAFGINRPDSVTHE